jgi:hypothetical protein
MEAALVVSTDPTRMLEEEDADVVVLAQPLHISRAMIMISKFISFAALEQIIVSI